MASTKKMKILVTGSTGVIGRHLIKNLKKEYPNAKIYGTYYKSSIEKNIKTKNLKENITYFKYREISKVNVKYDQIWHFATYGQPAKFINNWNEVINLNTTDILNLSKFLNPDGKFLYASSSELYGPAGTTNEDDAPASKTCTPRSVYIDSKRLGESIINSTFNRENFRIFRICLAYSPLFKKDDRRVMYELILKAIINKKIELIDDGSAIRQYLYIEDACKMMIELTNLKNKELLIGDEVPIFNIANATEPITIFELAKLISNFFKVPLKKGPKNNNIHSAPKVVKVFPKRFLKINKDFEFTKLSEGLKIVCNSANKKFSI
ncbi:hypothetical protein B0W81_02345 [Prochlorococcus sp. HOT_208_60]|nr:hypothetical protein B0W81_02345 [Prochlorococcus sp. HOT_208_60]